MTCIHPRLLATLIALGAVLGGCVGDQCFDESDCLSKSCTWGTCDSAIAKAAIEGSKPDDSSAEVPEPASCKRAASCEWLGAEDCKSTVGCEVERACMGNTECSFDMLVHDACPKDCALRSVRECHGACSLRFVSCEEIVYCDGRREDDCKATKGCVFE